MKQYQLHQQREQQREERWHSCDMRTIHMGSVSTTQSRSLGPERIGLQALEQLGLDQILRQCFLTREETAWVKAVVLTKLMAPTSELGTWKWLRQQSSLPELVGLPVDAMGKNAVYEVADILYAHKDRIEARLREREQQLFPQAATLYLYDFSNTFFDGSMIGFCIGHSLCNGFDSQCWERLDLRCCCSGRRRWSYRSNSGQ